MTETESPPAPAELVELVSQDAVTSSPSVGAPTVLDQGPPATPIVHVAPSLGVGGAP
jgi:hypothetical protein